MQKKKQILFFGDSITELGVKPEGYISVLQRKLQEKGLDKNYKLLGSGISGNKVYDLYLRLEKDVLAKKPDAVVIWIGVNDVWHKKTSGTGTDLDKFEAFYDALISKLQQKKIRVFMCTPAVVGERWDGSNELDAELDRYSNSIRKLAKTRNCTLVDLRSAFLEHLKTSNPSNSDKNILTYDGVHLNNAGDRFVAENMLVSLSSYLGLR